MLNKFLLLLILKLGLLHLGCFGQTENYILRNFTQEDGLPSNEVYYIFRDSRHFLWIATEYGIVRYNGKRMERINLPENVIFKIKEDSEGRIYFFSATGLLSYYYNEKVYPFDFNDNIKKAIAKIDISDATFSNQGDMLINSAQGHNLTIGQSGTVNKLDYMVLSKTAPTIFEIAKQSGQYFTRRTALQFEGTDAVEIHLKTGTKQLTYKFKSPAPVFNHYGCIESEDGSIYFFGGQSLLRLMPDGSSIVKHVPGKLLCVALINNQVWAGSLKNGLLLFDKNLNPLNQGTLLPNSSISSITRDHEKNIWFSTLEKGIYNIKYNGITQWSGNAALDQPVFRMANISDSMLLFANAEGLHSITNGITKTILLEKNTRISEIYVEGKTVFLGGNISKLIPNIFAIKTQINDPRFDCVFSIPATSEMLSLGANEYLVNHVRTFSRFSLKKKVIDSIFLTKNKDKPHSTNFIYRQSNIFQTSKKEILLSNSTGLYRLDTIKSEPIKYRINQQQFLERGVGNLQQLPNGYLLVGLRFGGLLIVNGDTVVGHITEQEGLINNTINYILPENNRVWIATATGISAIELLSFAPLQYRIKNIGKNEGLYNTHIYQLLFFKDKLLVATNNGIFQINNPKTIFNEKRPDVPFYITGISYANIDTFKVTAISVPYNSNKIVVRYSGLSFSSADEIKYYYRLSTNDSIWNENTSEQLILENLTPGNYTLQMKAMISSQHRSSGILTLDITIEKPFWETAWFRALVVALIASLTIFIYRARIKKIKKQEREKSEMKSRLLELEQTALRLQMNPHFIFNCLASIQQLILLGDREAASDYLVKFSWLIRQTLEQSEHSFISISKEIAYLQAYVYLEQMRQPGQFEFKIEADDTINLDGTMIPNMMMQPIIENAIRHGIRQLTNRKGLITLSIQATATHLLFTITDNGIGFTTLSRSKHFTSHKSYATEILSKRLALLYNLEPENMFFTAKDTFDENGIVSGARVTIQLPYQPSK